MVPYFPIDLVAPDGTPWQVSTMGELEEVRARGYKLQYSVDGVDMPVADPLVVDTSAPMGDVVQDAPRPGLVRSTVGDSAPVETRDGVPVGQDSDEKAEAPADKAAEPVEKPVEKQAPAAGQQSEPEPVGDAATKPSSRRRAVKES